MGQKTHPYGFRLGIIKGWRSRWFSSKNYPELLQEDLLIRRYVNKRLEHAGVAEIIILRAPKKVTIDIHTAKPGIVIGRKGAEVDKLKEELQMLTGKEILLNIVEVKKPELSASLVAQQIAHQLEGRVSFRRAMKKAVATTMKSGAEGIKIICSGRLGGAEIARSEKYHQGRVPLHTLRADIDFAQATAHTTYGTIGVKTWICRGEIIDKEKIAASIVGDLSAEKDQAAQPQARREKPQAGPEEKGRGEQRRRRDNRGRGAQRRQGDRKPSARDMDRSGRKLPGDGTGQSGGTETGGNSEPAKESHEPKSEKPGRNTRDNRQERQ